MMVECLCFYCIIDIQYVIVFHYDGRMIVENNYYHALTYCETTANNQP